MLFLIDVYYGDSCTSKLHVFVSEMTHVGDGVQVLTDELTQYASTCAVKDANPRHAHQNGVVDEVHHSVHCLVASHAAYVDVLVEVLLAVFHRGTCHLRGLDG